MPDFRVYFDDAEGSTRIVQAPDPEAARTEARRRFSLPIRKIKLDRGTVPAHPPRAAPDAPRVEGNRHALPANEILQRAAAFAAERANPIAARVRLSPPGPVTTPDGWPARWPTTCSTSPPSRRCGG